MSHDRRDTSSPAPSPYVPPLAPALFDLDPEVVWVMHCAEGPVPRASVEAARQVLTWELRPWELELGQWIGLPGRVKAQAAALFGGTENDFTLAPSTSGGLSIVAETFPFEAGDEVLLPLGEFPANYWPWRALAPRGVTVREVPLWPGHQAGPAALASTPPPPGVDPEATLLDAIGPRTRLVAASWVRFQDGLRLDLGRLAAGCQGQLPLVVDGIQGAGTLPLDLGRLTGEDATGLVAFATGVHKGLLAPQGAGLLYTSPAFRQQLRPRGSWLSVADGANFGRPNTDFDRPWLPGGSRFEQGGHGALVLAPLAASLQLLAETTPARIAAHIDTLQAQLLQGLLQSGGATWHDEPARLDALRQEGRLGSILGLHHGSRGATFLADLIKAGVEERLFASIREGYLRIALHGWHDAAAGARVRDWLVTT